MGVMTLDQELATWYGSDPLYGMGMRPCSILPPMLQVPCLHLLRNHSALLLLRHSAMGQAALMNVGD